MNIENIKFETDVLAIMPEALDSVIAKRQEIVIEDNINIEEAIQRRATKFKDIRGKVVTVPLHGYISHKPSVWSAYGYETSSETFAGWLTDLVNNKDVGAIVIDINSPGGTVAGLTGVTEKIRSLRGNKPIIAVVNDLMASAAYFIGSAADEIVSDPDALTGSIGTIGMHVDYSQALENAGIKVTYVHAGKYKAEGSPYKPLDDEAKQDWQSMVDSYYENFVSAVAVNRGITANKVKADFGQGRVLKATKAREVGMVDRIATLEQVIKDLMPKNKSKARAKAEFEYLNL